MISLPSSLAPTAAASAAAAATAATVARRQPLSPLHRTYFAFVALFALWVGAWGTFLPGQVAMALPWQVPPLHARVIGAMYLSGLVLMAACRRRQWVHEVAVGLRMASVWTGMLLAASLLHLEQFDPANPRVWFWFFAYVTFPLCGAWLAWRDRAAVPAGDGVGSGVEEGSGSDAGTVPMPRWMLLLLSTLGISFCALAALLFLAPQVMQSVWPWKASVLLIQIYAGPCLSLGVGSLLLTRPRHVAEISTTSIGMLAFVALVLLASWLHRGLFNFAHLSAVLWFAALIVANVALGAVLAGRLRAARKANAP